MILLVKRNSFVSECKFGNLSNSNIDKNHILYLVSEMSEVESVPMQYQYDEPYDGSILQATSEYAMNLVLADGLSTEDEVNVSVVGEDGSFTLYIEVDDSIAKYLIKKHEAGVLLNLMCDFDI